MRVRRAAAFAVLPIALAVLAACGSSAKPLSKADFITKADAICQKYVGLSAQSTKDLKHPSPAQVMDAIRTRLFPLLQQQDKELAKLEPPVAERAAVAKFLSDLKAAPADMGANTKVFVDAHGVTKLFQTASLEAHNYGLRVCASIGKS